MKYGMGVDVSKGKSTIAIVSLEGEVLLKPTDFKHTSTEMERLEKIIKNISKEDLKIVMEDTGTYHLPILGYFLEQDYCVVSKNALGVKKYLDRDIRKKKTDKIDSLKLANYCCENWYKLTTSYVQGDVYDNLKFLSRQYLSQMNIQINQKVNFSNLCDLLFPGYYQLLDENNYVLGLEIFKNYYHPSIVLNKKESQFITEIDEISKKMGHRTAGKNLAIKIYKLANETIAPRPNNKHAQLIAESCVDTLISTLKVTKNIISEMKEVARELPEYDVVLELPGVGERLAPRLIAEIGDIKRFKNAGSLIAYAGLDAPPYESGQFVATIRHISKRGNKYLRKTGYEVMQCIKRNGENEIKDFILKKEDEGKPSKVAKIAGLNKFLRVYYGTVKKVYS